jgi:UDP-3-O-[3-hydroxymyristoyl] glucosamine N-acyltransferase
VTRSYRLDELADRLNAQLVGPPSLMISGVGSLEAASGSELTHLSNAAYRDQLRHCQAAAVLMRPEDCDLWSGPALLVDNPYLAFARATQLFVMQEHLPDGIDQTANVAASAVLGNAVAVGPGVVVGANTRIGDGVRLHANSVVGADCVLEAGVELKAGVVLYRDVHLGRNCVVHANAVLGADGFGFTPDAKGHLQEIAQLGGLRVGCDVSIGASSTIDRGTLDNTVIEDGVKIDNQVQIGHNCHIGAHSVICGCVGIVGSTRIGRHCVLAGGVGIGGAKPITLCDGVTVSGMTHVSSSIDEPGVYSGGVLHNKSRQWKRNILRLQSLDDLFRRVAKLERRER